MPSAIEVGSGVTAIETSAGGVTVSAAVPDMPPEVAVIVVVPVATVVARPVPLIVAFASTDDVHVALPVRSWVEPLV